MKDLDDESYNQDNSTQNQSHLNKPQIDRILDNLKQGNKRENIKIESFK